MRTRVSNFISVAGWQLLSRGQHHVLPTRAYPELDDSWTPRQLAAFRELLRDLKATGATVKIGRVSSTGRGVNYYDRAVKEADRRNRSLLIEGD